MANVFLSDNQLIVRAAVNDVEETCKKFIATANTFKAKASEILDNEKWINKHKQTQFNRHSTTPNEENFCFRKIYF